MKIRLSRDLEKASVLFICAYLILNELNSLAQDFFDFSDAQISFIKYTMMLVLALLILKMLISMNRKELSVFFILECLAGLLYVYSALVGVEASLLQEWMMTTLPVCIPAMFAAMQIQDFRYFYHVLVKLSWILLLLLILDMFGGMKMNAYDMHFSYGILFVSIIHMNRFFDGKRLYLLPFIMEGFMLLAYGSRGALLCVATFILLKIFFTPSKISRKILYAGGTIFLIGGIYFLLNHYGSTLSQSLLRIGFRNRTLQLFLRGEFVSYDSGRFALWARVMSLIRERPFLGWGIRGAIGEMKNTYPHNLFLDLFLTFGIPFGLFLSLGLIWKILKSFITLNGRKRELFFIFFSQVFVALMVSGTLFTSYYFFILLGLLFNKQQAFPYEKEDLS